MRVYVTLVASDDYAQGALVLAQSLRIVSSQYPLVCLCTPNLAQSTIDRLRSVTFALHFVPTLDSHDPYHLGLLGRPELGVTLTKLHLWTLVEYSRMVYLDADVLIRANIDHLFDREEEFLASPDCGWPDCFNSGLFVFSPNLSVHQDLVRLLHTRGSFDGGDQGLLNDYFGNWTRLSFTYNVTPTAFYSYLPAFESKRAEIKAFHFIGNNKPWTWSLDDSGRAYHHHFDENSNLKEAVQSWWDVYHQFKQEHGYDDMAEEETASQATTSTAVSSFSSSSSFSFSTQTNEQLRDYRANWSTEQFREAGSHYIDTVDAATTTTTTARKELTEESSEWFQVYDTTPDLESVQISALSPVTKHANALNMSEFFRLYPKASEYNDNAWRQRPTMKKVEESIKAKEEVFLEAVKLPPPMFPEELSGRIMEEKAEEKASVLGKQEIDDSFITKPRSYQMVAIKEAPWENDVALATTTTTMTTAVEEAKGISGKEEGEIERFALEEESLASFNDDLWRIHHPPPPPAYRSNDIPASWMEWTWQMVRDIKHCCPERVAIWEKELKMIERFGFPRGVIMSRTP